MSDREIVGPNDDPVSPRYHCDLCGAAYYSEDLANRCCRSVTPDGGFHQPLTSGDAFFKGLILALGVSGWVWLLLILWVVFG